MAAEAMILMGPFKLVGGIAKAHSTEEDITGAVMFYDKQDQVKAPGDRAAMLKVSGVGEAKYEKYGERFIEAVTAFMDEHHGAVTGIKDEEIHDRTNGAIRARLKKHGLIE